MTDESLVQPGPEHRALERIGWHLEDAFLGDAVPTIRRQHNLVVACPPAGAYAVPALAALTEPSRPERLTSLVLAHPSMLHELAWLLARLDPTSNPTFVVAGGRAHAALFSSDQPVRLLLTTPETAGSLVARSRLHLNQLETLLVAWPEVWESDAAFNDLMTDLPRDCQRLVYTSAPDEVAGLTERYAWRALTVGVRLDPPLSTTSLPARTVLVPWHRRSEALGDALTVLDPASVAVWTATEAVASDVRLALAGTTPGAVVFHDHPPKADLIVAYDLPTPSRLAGLAEAGSVLVLVPPLAGSYMTRLGLAARPLRLPGVLEAARAEAAERRTAVARVVTSRKLHGAALALAPLFDRFEPAHVAAALYHLWTEGSEGSPVVEPPREGPSVSTSVARMFVNAGRNDGVTVADLVAMLIKEIGVDRAAIGRIELKDTHALVELPGQEIDSIVQAMDGKLLRQKRVHARRDRGKPVRRR
jgi:hypothetical protein